MRTEIPRNAVRHAYQAALNAFITQVREETGDALRMAYLAGSYARGDATDASDLDVFCIFEQITRHTLEAVGRSARSVCAAYGAPEINAQCMSVREYTGCAFAQWAEHALMEKDGVLLYGTPLVSMGEEDVRKALQESYPQKLADVLMSVRHYLCVDAPVQKLTHAHIKTYILKPLLYALRQERYCSTGAYPLSTQALLCAYAGEERLLVEYALDANRFEADAARDHRGVLMTLHRLIAGLLAQAERVV